jgi:hypothetical protein
MIPSSPVAAQSTSPPSKAGRAPRSSAPAAQGPAQARPAAPVPTMPGDSRVVASAPVSPLERNYDTVVAARLVMAKFGNHAAMGLIIQARGGDHHEFTAQQQADAMYGIRDALGLSQTSLHPDALELRDLDHFINMSGPIQDDFPFKPTDSPVRRGLMELGREAVGLKCAVMAVGYSGAKAIAQNTPILHHSEYLNGKGTSRASLREVRVGLQGVWDGVMGH